MHNIMKGVGGNYWVTTPPNPDLVVGVVVIGIEPGTTKLAAFRIESEDGRTLARLAQFTVAPVDLPRIPPWSVEPTRASKRAKASVAGHGWSTWDFYPLFDRRASLWTYPDGREDGVAWGDGGTTIFPITAPSDRDRLWRWMFGRRPLGTS